MKPDILSFILKKKYWLVNVATGQAITSPTQSGQVRIYS
jgi:hypothetical protein